MSIAVHAVERGRWVRASRWSSSGEGHRPVGRALRARPGRAGHDDRTWSTAASNSHERTGSRS
jgi:hypothetical protein